MEVQTKMATIKDEAQAYEPLKTKNIAELDRVSLNEQIVEKTYTDSDGKEFTLKVIEIEGEDYRVQVSVIKSIKAIIEEKPEIKFFKVVRTGEGLKTVYTVITLEDY